MVSTLLKSIPWLLFILSLFLVGNGSLCESKSFCMNEYIAGQGDLILKGQNLEFNLVEAISSVEFRFRNGLQNQFIKSIGAETEQKVSYHDKWLRLEGIKQNTLKGYYAIRISDPNLSVYINRISDIKVNGNEIKISHFMRNFASINSSTTSYRYLFSVSNLGFLFSNYLGIYLPKIIIWFLFPLVIVQLYYMAVTIIDKFPREIAMPVYDSTIDWITRSLAIPLGLLGTITSLWTSFEFMSVSFGGVYEVLQLLADGLFTTFLGILAYSMMLGRNVVNGRYEE